MACPDIEDIEKADCLNNTGGLGLEIAVWQSKDRTAMDFDPLTWLYDNIEFGSSPNILPVIVGFHKNTATLTQTAEGDEGTANSTNEVSLSITVNSQDTDKSRAISVMAAGQRELDIALSYKNGTKWFLPNMVLKSFTGNSGATQKDGSNYVLTFTGEMEALAGGLMDADYENLITNGKTVAPLAPSSVEVNPQTATAGQGSTVKFSAIVAPSGASQAVTWGIDTATALAINVNTGLVSVGATTPTGTYTVTATASDGITTDTATLTVV